MDYARPISSNRPFTVPVVNLALLMLPASNNASMSSLSPSPIVLNPGGPGGSGVEWLVSMGEYIRTILGPSVDIIGFDPRGVGRSTPKADCFGSSGGTNEAEAFAAFQRTSWGVDTQLAGVVNSTYSTLEKLDTRYRTLGKLCQYRHDKFGNDSIFKYLHTRDSARDMLSIVDAWDRQFPKASRVSLEGADVTATDSSWSRGKLHYWGWSYGSHLGTTFASMFPNRVGRMLLDGIIDAEGYSDPVWIDSIQDADSVFASFFRYCYEAGKDRCAFYPQQDAAVVDPSSIEARYRRLVARLKENPLKIVTILPDVGPVPQIITHDLVKSAIWSSLYSPIQSFPAIAQMLDLLDRGDEFEIGAANLFPGTILDYRPYCVKESDGVRIPESMRGVREALYTIMCSDKSEPVCNILQARVKPVI